MANKTITIVDVAPSAAAETVVGLAAEAIDAGELVYMETLTGPTPPAASLADATDADKHKVTGVAANSAAVGQYVVVVRSDPDFDPGYAATAGELLIASATPGATAEEGDLASGMYPAVVGFGLAGGNIAIDFGTNSYGADPVP